MVFLVLFLIGIAALIYWLQTSENTTRLLDQPEGSKDKTPPIKDPVVGAIDEGSIPTLSPDFALGAALEIVGESHCQQNLSEVAQKLGYDADEHTSGRFIAELVREDDNPDDANAIAVLGFDLRIGYISKKDLKRFDGIFERFEDFALPVTCVATLKGGFVLDSGHRTAYGAELRLTDPVQISEGIV
ncbi:hypothetical protein KAI87_15760 [Myxococcota bacterium]|nr:hypothetical protein [Myxococcota bacterium]